MRRIPPVVPQMCLAEVATMVGVFGFPALLPAFLVEWSLSNREAGWISGTLFAAYAIAAPVLVSLTDRVDARRIYLIGAACTTAAMTGFALLAQGFWSALALQALAGVGLAGTYMPGLRVMVDRIPAAARVRAVPFYTASFSLGTAASYFVTGQVGHTFGWRAAFGLAGGCAAVALGVAALQARHAPAAPSAPRGRLLDFRPVLRNRPAMGYVLGYASHVWELFAFRSWVVAFLTAAALSSGTEATGLFAPATVATAGALVAMAASIGGAEIAARLGRARTVMAYMVASGVFGLGVGFSGGSVAYAAVAALTVAYAALIQLDSAALTTGAVETADPERRGATLAVHSLVGFLAGGVGPLVLGWVLDASESWGLAFASAGAVALLGPLAMAWGRRGAHAPPP